MRQWLARRVDIVLSASLIAALVGGFTGIGTLVWHANAPTGVGPRLAQTYRAADNPWRYAPSSIEPAAVPDAPAQARADAVERSFGITAHIHVPHGQAQGMIVTRGGSSGGWALYIQDGRPVFHYNAVGRSRYTIAAQQRLAPGQQMVAFKLYHDDGADGASGTAVLSANNMEIARGRIEEILPLPGTLHHALDIGKDTGTPVNQDYRVPFTFTGKIVSVVVEHRESSLPAP